MLLTFSISAAESLLKFAGLNVTADVLPVSEVSPTEQGPSYFML